MDAAREHYRANFEAVARVLDDRGIRYLRPRGSFYLWVDVGHASGGDVAAWAEQFLRSERVAVAPGSAFGRSGEGWIRICLAATQADVLAGVERLPDAVSRTIVIAGAHGFMGTRFAELYRAAGDRVVTVGRRDADALWGDTDAITRLVDGADLLVNLAGKSVNCRYNERNKAEIFRSRLETTAELGRAVAAAAVPPPVWFNASTATIYRHADDRPQTEEDGELGHGFSVEVAKAWEKTFFDAARDGVRQVALRTAITLGDGSALTPLVRLARIGMGGPQLGGPSNRGAGLDGGRQRFSWVHLDDVFRAMRFLEEHDLDGVVNVTSPNPSTNREVMATLRRVLGVPFGIPLPRIALEVGARVIRTETELILKSRWVLPKRLLDAGFEFRYPELEGALREILKR